MMMKIQGGGATPVIPAESAIVLIMMHERERERERERETLYNRTENRCISLLLLHLIWAIVRRW